MNWNLAGCIYGRSSIKIAHFVLSQSVNKYDHHMQFLFLVGRFLKIFSSETPWKNKAKFYRKHLCKVLFKISSFHSNWTTDMVIIGNSCFWQAETKQKKSPLKLRGTTNCYFVGMMYGRSNSKLSYFVPIIQVHLIWPL